MKKFALSMMIALVATMLINIPVSQARQVRFADVGAENFVNQIRQLLKSNDTTKNLIISELRRAKNHDIPEKGMSVWKCNFSMLNDLDNRGILLIFTDSEGYVFMVGFACPRSEPSFRSASCVMTAVWESISLTYDEIVTLTTSNSTWSSYNNRRYVTSRGELDDFIVILQEAHDS